MAGKAGVCVCTVYDVHTLHVYTCVLTHTCLLCLGTQVYGCARGCLHFPVCLARGVLRFPSVLCKQTVPKQCSLNLTQ